MRRILLVMLLLVASCSVPSLEPGQKAIPGNEYAVTVFTHCGFYEVDFSGRIWTPSSIERGSTPEGTDSMATSGTFEIVAPDELVFRAGSGLEVRFRPAPADLEPMPACD